MGKISVIIPLFHGHDTLKQALHSVAMQSIIDDAEIVIVNDGDAIDYSDILGKFSDLNIKYIVRERNGGCAASRNTGIKNAKNSFITFLDSDDNFVSPLSLEIMYNRIVAEKADVLVSVFESEMRFKNGVAIKKMERQVTWTHSKLYRKQFLLDNNIFFKEELRLNEDVEFNQMVLDLGAKVCEIPMVTSLWRDNPNSVTHESLYKNKKSYVEAVTVYLQDCAGRKMDSSKVVLRTVQNLIVVADYFNIVLDECPENKDDFLEVCREYWKLAEPLVRNVSDDEVTKFYLHIMKQQCNVIPSITFVEFLNLIRN